MRQQTLSEELLALFEHTGFVDEERFSYQGETQKFEPLRPRATREAAGYPTIVAGMAQAVYDVFYLRPDVARNPRLNHAPLTPSLMSFDRLLELEYTEWLGRSISTRDAWSDGWTLAGEKASTYLVERNGELRQVRREDLSEVPSKGDRVRLRVDPGSAALQPGWYHVRGETDHDREGGASLRFYWNVSRAGAPHLIREITRNFNAAGVPMRMKIVANPSQYTRSDAAVLYVPISSWPRVRSVVSDVFALTAKYLRTDTPGLAKRLAPGLAAAEDPGDGQSFGVSRSSTIAEGLWDAHLEGDTSATGRFRHVERRFKAQGLDIERPYLNAGSRADYAIDLPAARPSIAVDIPDTPELN